MSSLVVVRSGIIRPTAKLTCRRRPPSTIIVTPTIVVLLLAFVASVVSAHEYVLIGVSGGLQDGFPDHVKMDYNVGLDDEVRAIFVGKALVRGTKAYLDVMQEGWRQYSPEPQQPLINSVNIVSGCHHHANQYWAYLVDSRHAVTILNHEPRFLSITPDTAMVDLNSNETDVTVKVLARHEIQKQGMSDDSVVAIPVVVAVWYHPSFVPSPPIRIHKDGTRVTNFPESLALWANVNDSDRVSGCEMGRRQECTTSPNIEAAQKRYWDGIRNAVRAAEANRPSQDEWKANGPPFDCPESTRLGVGPNQARINYLLSPSEIVGIFDKAGYTLDLKNAYLRQRT